MKRKDGITVPRTCFRTLESLQYQWFVIKEAMIIILSLLRL
ncbi:hypothetical protein [Paenibacillus dendrobii]|nr:hypothetical protein [Paenibacillus dendrobii]